MAQAHVNKDKKRKRNLLKWFQLDRSHHSSSKNNSNNSNNNSYNNNINYNHCHQLAQQSLIMVAWWNLGRLSERPNTRGITE
jgi:hypothetical protein